ncbi:MAG: hypothetical protein IPN14_12700 [Bacteroidetes bacterium]|nr:hypothetical protein [Bacteroidota bacterium]
MKKNTFITTRYSLLLLRTRTATRYATRYSLLALIFLLMQGITFKANAAIVTRDLKVDFGAEGNGLDDALSVQKNTDAFIKAGIFFSNFLAPGDEGILTIPSTFQGQNAVYYVGKQIPTGQSYTVTCTDIMPGVTVSSSVTRTLPQAMHCLQALLMVCYILKIQK